MGKIFILFFILLGLVSCNKEPEKVIDKKEIYVEGKAIGEPVTKEIDENGGIIELPISNARIIFHPKTFQTKTFVSLQPITNLKANFGNGIRLSSEFRNIRIEMKYPNNGLEPKLFGIFYSQSNKWLKAEDLSLDTLKQTISMIQRPEKQQSNIVVSNKSTKLATHSNDYVVGVK